MQDFIIVIEHSQSKAGTSSCKAQVTLLTTGLSVNVTVTLALVPLGSRDTAGVSPTSTITPVSAGITVKVKRREVRAGMTKCGLL